MKFTFYFSWLNWTFGFWRIANSSSRKAKDWAFGIDIGPIELMWERTK